VKREFRIILLSLVAVMIMVSCDSSREMSTARLEFSRGEYSKAIDFLHKEIANNPANEEAYLLLLDSYIQREDFYNASLTLEKAVEIVKTPEYVERLSNVRNNIWVNAYNRGVQTYNQYFNEQNTRFLDSALYYFNIGKNASPRTTDFYFLLGNIYEIKEDTTASMNSYIDFIKYSENEINFAKSKKIHLNMDRNQVTSIVGQPSRVIPQGRQNQDSILVDMLTVDGKEVFLTYSSKSEAPFKLMGWRVDLPSNWLPQEKSMPSEFNIAPIAALAQIYFNRGDFQNSLKYTNILLDVDATNEIAGEFQIRLYQELDMMDEAIKSFEEVLKANPNNKNVLARYGDLWANTEEYDKAIEYYERALKVDPDFAVVLRNLGSVMKNKAGVMQLEEIEKMDKDDKYEEQRDRYLPFLKKSADYFEKALKTPDFRGDMIVLGELANIYFVTEENDKLQLIKKQLEAIEFTVDDANKEQYYLILIKIYGDLKEPDKMREIEAKLNKLGS